MSSVHVGGTGPGDEGGQGAGVLDGPGAGHDSDEEGRDKSYQNLYDAESSDEDLPNIPRHARSDSHNDEDEG